MASASPPPPIQNPGQTNDYCLGRMLVHSSGIWSDMESESGKPYQESFLLHSLPRMLAQISIIFLLTQALYLLLKRFRLPRIFSELLAGILLGPTFLEFYKDQKKVFFIMSSDTYLTILSRTGYMFFIFLTGVKMDPGLISRSGFKAWTIGAIAVCAPNIAFISFNEVLIETCPLFHSYRWNAVSSTIRIQSLYAFPVIALLLVDLKIMNSELGRLALATGLITDLLSNTVFSMIYNWKMGTVSNMPMLRLHGFVLTIGLAAAFVLTIRPLSRMIIKRTTEGKPVDTVYVILIAFLVFFASIMSDNTGMSFQYGPFILGLAIPDGPPLGSTLVAKLDTIVSGFLAPLMVSLCGMKVNLSALYDLRFIGNLWYALLICYAIKYFSVLTPALALKVPIKDAVSLAFILCTQGVVQMSFYLNNSINQTYDKETFSMLCVAVLIVAGVSHIVVASLYDYSRTYNGYQKRDIQHNSANSELRLMTVAHRLDDVLAARKLLDVSCPYRESPLSVYSLFLVELVGRATPLLIDHQLGQKSSSSSSSSNSRLQKIVDIFRSYEQQYMGLTYVQLYTSISLQKFMHHDICSLAFDKLASMIILPFHKKWNHQGKLIQDSNNIRTMNNFVLDMAPCSVGILIDRSQRKKSQVGPKPQHVHVGVIFLGGDDDREALSYARRMSRSPSVYLTVVRFVPWEAELGDSQWDVVLDAELLKDMRFLAQQQDNVVYREEMVKDGAETALVIHDMEAAFDLILVGRRHRIDMPQLVGLDEWNDIPELGAVGDMLAVGAITSPVSVVVVQQQYTKSK